LASVFVVGWWSHGVGFGLRRRRAGFHRDFTSIIVSALVFRVASAVRQERCFGIGIDVEQVTLRRGMFGVESTFGQLISNLSVYSA